MSRALGGAATVLAACTTAQSARVVPVDRTTITAAVNRTTDAREDSDDDVLWGGQVMVRHGLARRVDGGLTLGRTPGTSGQVSAIGMDGRIQLTPPDARVVVTLGAAVGLLWSERNGPEGHDFTLRDYVLGPTLHLGFDLTSAIELVIAPRLVVLIPHGADGREEAYSASIGLRLHDPSRTWAIHPELVYLGVLDEEERFLTLGVSVTAGN